MPNRQQRRPTDDEMKNESSWRELVDSDQTLSAPSRITDIPVDPSLKVLPTDQMDWPDFERLLVRLTREVLGLRQVRLYGTPGQKQQGLDLVGIERAGTVVGVQGKKYQRFAKNNLDKAVATFLDGTVPFQVRKLAVGVSCRTNSTQIIDRLTELNIQHGGDVEIELWDQDHISELLRPRPEIVREFFGQATAVRFCGPLVEFPLPIPPLDAAGLAEAIARGPIAATGAQVELDAAQLKRTSDPDAAIDHVRAAQSLLDEAGFPAHAQQLDQTVTDILSQANRNSEAAVILVDAIWRSLDEDDTEGAYAHLRRVKALAAGSSATSASVTAAEAAMHAAQHPMGEPPSLAAAESDLPLRESARLYR
jgi:hypothetical protein